MILIHPYRNILLTFLFSYYDDVYPKYWLYPKYYQKLQSLGLETLQVQTITNELNSIKKTLNIH